MNRSFGFPQCDLTRTPVKIYQKETNQSNPLFLVPSHERQSGNFLRTKAKHDQTRECYLVLGMLSSLLGLLGVSQLGIEFIVGDFNMICISLLLVIIFEAFLHCGTEFLALSYGHVLAWTFFVGMHTVLLVGLPMASCAMKKDMSWQTNQEYPAIAPEEHPLASCIFRGNFCFNK